jgi:hypothetical protein
MALWILHSIPNPGNKLPGYNIVHAYGIWSFSYFSHLISRLFLDCCFYSFYFILSPSTFISLTLQHLCRIGLGYSEGMDTYDKQGQNQNPKTYKTK